MPKSAEELRSEFGHWREHARYPLADWRGEVADNGTRLGYWEWVAALLADDDEPDDAVKVA